MFSDGLMFGALGALLQGDAHFEAIYRWAARWPLLLTGLLFFGSGALGMIYQNYWNLPIGITIDGALALLWLLWLIRNPHSLQGRLLNLPVVAWAGRLSYSMYIWQTFFYPPLQHRGLWPAGLVQHLSRQSGLHCWGCDVLILLRRAAVAAPARPDHPPDDPVEIANTPRSSPTQRDEARMPALRPAEELRNHSMGLQELKASSMALSDSAAEKLPWPPPATMYCPFGIPAASSACFNSAD